MANNKEALLRIEGMQYAIDLVDKLGVDKARDEIAKRSRYRIPLSIKQKELDEFCNKVKVNVVNHMTVLFMVTLRDELGFGHDRIQRVMRRFWQKAECFEGDFTNWEEQTQILAEEVGIEVNLQMQDCTVKIK